jgi:hypothetical protein
MIITKLFQESRGEMLVARTQTVRKRTEWHTQDETFYGAGTRV